MIIKINKKNIFLGLCKFRIVILLILLAQVLFTFVTFGDKPIISEDYRGADSLKFDTAPSVVFKGKSYSLLLDYEITASGSGKTKYLQVDLLDESNQWYGGGELELGLGPQKGKASIFIKVAANAPVSSKYKWNAFIAQKGDNWQKATIIDSQLFVNVKAIDSLKLEEMPLEVFSGITYDLVVSYEIQATGDGRGKYIQIDLLDEWYAWHGGGTVSLGAGTASGKVTIPIKVAETAPAGSKYQWNVFIAQEGDNWQKATVADSWLLITVQKGDSLRFNIVPSYLEPDESYDLVCDYDIKISDDRRAKYIQIDLLDIGGNWYGGGNIGLGFGPSSGSITIPIKIAKDVPPGSKYKWNAFISRIGDNWQDATAFVSKDRVAVSLKPHLYY